MDALTEISVLLFTVMGVRLGIDTDQIGHIDETGWTDDDREREEDERGIFGIHEKLDFGRRGTAISYEAPRVVMSKELGGGRATGIVIDQTEDIVTIPIDSIRQMPDLIRGRAKQSPVWGVALLQDQPVMLVDLDRLVGK